MVQELLPVHAPVEKLYRLNMEAFAVETGVHVVLLGLRQSLNLSVSRGGGGSFADSSGHPLVVYPLGLA